MEFNNINDFKQNFYNIYHKKIQQLIKLMEDERKQIRNNRVIEMIIFLSIATILIINALNSPIISLNDIIGGIILLMIARFRYSNIQKTFELKIKMKFMNDLMKAFGSFRWSNAPLIEDDEIDNSKLINKSTPLFFDDNFYAVYKNMPIKMSEIMFKKHKGLLISLNLGKNFSGHTILRKKIGLQSAKFYKEVKLEDPQFQKMYFVESTDQVEARYILTPAFMERLKKITNSFNSNDVQCSFRDEKILIYLPSPNDLFAIGDLNKPLTLAEPMQKLLAEIISILEMIDHLKLAEKV